MNTLLAAGKTAQALILGVVVVGCATAATITGHLTGNDLLTVFTTVGIGGAVVAGAHVGGSVATNAATTAAAAQGPGVGTATQPAAVAVPPGPVNVDQPAPAQPVAPVATPAQPVAGVA